MGCKLGKHCFATLTFIIQVFFERLRRLEMVSQHPHQGDAVGVPCLLGHSHCPSHLSMQKCHIICHTCQPSMEPCGMCRAILLNEAGRDTPKRHRWAETLAENVEKLKAWKRGLGLGEDEAPMDD